MSWIGKLLGFLCGALILGPLGAFLGLFLGHLIDRAGQGHASAKPRVQAATQRTLFNATFLVMGHLAKADGIVTEDEIRAARAVMQRMGLDNVQRAEAIRLFTAGKAANFKLDATLQSLAQACRQHRSLLRTFLEIQLQAAYSGGTPSAEEQAILQHICKTLGIAQLNFRFLNMIYGRFQQQNSYTSAGAGYTAQRSSLADYYAMLEIDKSATDAEVKRAYRKMMSQHHPDKLAAKGLPDAMLKIATEKTQQIQKAYEHIRTARGMK